MRMNNSNPGFMGSTSPITKNIIIINVIMWFAQVVLQRRGIDLSDYLGLHYVESSSFHIWQPITYMFMHDPYSFMHVFSNMFAVFMFGRTLEHLWGSKRFLGYYFIRNRRSLYTNAGNLSTHPVYKKRHVSRSNSDVYIHGATLLRQNMNFIDPLQANLNLLLNTVTIGASGAVFGILLAFRYYSPMPHCLSFFPFR